MNEEQKSQSFTATRKMVVGQVIAGKYKLLEKIGSGSFGSVFKTQNLKNGEILATKFERRDDKMSLLVREIKILNELKGMHGFPQIQFYGRDEQYNFLMETYLGNNLEELIIKCGNSLSVATVINIGSQMIERIQDILSIGLHSKNFIHRDIKPENFVISKEDCSQIFMIDFGLSKYYKDTKGKHIPFLTDKGLVGTARYASANALKGNEQSRKDDLESIGYLLLYLLNGKLPWMNIQQLQREEKYQKILDMKDKTPIEILCENSPNQLLKYMKYVKQLEFESEPDYNYLKQIFEKQDYSPMDWLLLEEFKMNDISIDNELEKEESNQMKSKQKNNKITSSNYILTTNKFLEVPKMGIDPNISLDSSKLNNYQVSQQRSNGIFVMPSQKQFDDVKILTNKTILVNSLFDDLEVSQDDKPDIILKKPRELSVKKKNHF